MDGEDEFYQEENLNKYEEQTNLSNLNDEEYENDRLINTSIELFIECQDYCKDEAIPLGENLSSMDLFHFIKYGYIL